MLQNCSRSTCQRFHTLLYRARQRKGLRVFALGQRLRHVADHVTHTAGMANGECVHLSAPEFHEFIFPPLSWPKRGPTCKLGSHHVLNRILWVLCTGMPWKCLSGPKDPAGKPALDYPTVDKVFAKWADDGSLWQAFIASGRHLADQKHLDLRVLHGDGTNTVAQKGAMGSGLRGTYIRRARRASRSRTIMAMSSLPSPWVPSMNMRIERTFAWEDTFTRLLLRFERLQQRHYGTESMAYTLINLREFCGVYNSQPVREENPNRSDVFTTSRKPSKTRGAFHLPRELSPLSLAPYNQLGEGEKATTPVLLGKKPISARQGGRKK
jgi:hypothetical protein